MPRAATLDSRFRGVAGATALWGEGVGVATGWGGEDGGLRNAVV